jgi:hypothetical protein
VIERSQPYKESLIVDEFTASTDWELPDSVSVDVLLPFDGG